MVQPPTQVPGTHEDHSFQSLKGNGSTLHARKLNQWHQPTLPQAAIPRHYTPNHDIQKCCILEWQTLSPKEHLGMHTEQITMFHLCSMHNHTNHNYETRIFNHAVRYHS